MEAARRGRDLDLPCGEAGLAVRRRLMELRWPIHHEEELRTKEGRRIAVAFGTTSPLGGASALSTFFRGAAQVAFLVRIEELGPARTRVDLLAGGTEGWSGNDYGRNAGVAERFLRDLGRA